MTNITNSGDIKAQVRALCEGAKAASRTLANLSGEEKSLILLRAAELLAAESDALLAANVLDLDSAEANGIPVVMLDRLRLTKERIDGIAAAVRELIALPDPTGEGERFVRPNGLVIRRVRAPLGVVAVIYESRPNVTADTAALCIKTGNACVLRGGKEALNTNRVIAAIFRRALNESGADERGVAFIDDPTREGTAALMEMRGLVDVLIPRGGKGLIAHVVQNSHVPVIETGAGNCHLYVDSDADLGMALEIAVNAKMQRPSVCNSIECLLVHSAVAPRFLPMLAEATRAGVHTLELRGCERTLAILPDAKAANAEDYDTEYNDYILSCRVVDSLDEAISHINAHNTGHSEAIVTRSLESARRFQLEVDAAAVYVNASTRFTDGGEFGFGAEIGISTQKLHARGPMGPRELTTVKYLVDGCGQIRS